MRGRSGIRHQGGRRRAVHGRAGVRASAAPSFSEATWATLERTESEPLVLDRTTLTDLPVPARRLLTRALPEGTALATGIELEMSGEIALNGRWMPFRARQILRGGVGFVWSPTVGGRLIRFTGADVLGPDGARTEFRLGGVIPVVRASGPDVERSAVGRLAAETVAWLPPALTPQRGATWRGIDESRAIVAIASAGERAEVEIAVDGEGRLERLSLQRWDSASRPAAYRGFHGTIEKEYVLADGVRIAGAGAVGWDRGPEDDERSDFFRFEVSRAWALEDGCRPATGGADT